jgi:hypothetical protein
MIDRSGFTSFNFKAESKCLTGLKNDKIDDVCKLLPRIITLNDPEEDMKEIRGTIELVANDIGDGTDAAKCDFVFANGVGKITISSMLVKKHL